MSKAACPHADKPPQSKSSLGEEPDKFFTSYADELERRAKVWTAKGINDDYLIATLQSMESSRRMLVEDAQRMLTLILTLFIAVGALVSFASTRGIETNRLELPIYGTALALLLTIPFLAKLSTQKITAAYEFYAASALNATLAHRSRSLHEGHQWMARAERLVTSLDKRNRDNPVKRVDFHANLIEEWMRQPGLKESSDQPNLIQVFIPIFGLTGVVAIMGSYLMVICGVMGVPMISQVLRDATWDTGGLLLSLVTLAAVSSSAFYAALKWKFTWYERAKKTSDDSANIPPTTASVRDQTAPCEHTVL